jgi:hypothetical protein
MNVASIWRLALDGAAAARDGADVALKRMHTALERARAAGVTRRAVQGVACRAAMDLNCPVVYFNRAFVGALFAKNTSNRLLTLRSSKLRAHESSIPILPGAFFRSATCVAAKRSNT